MLGRRPEDAVYVADRMSGTITFAPAVRLPGADSPEAMAAVPEAGAEIRAWYFVGGGRDGNVATGSLTVLRDQAGGIGGVTNPEPATGGRDSESGADALIRGPQQLHAIERAMTAEDYEAMPSRFDGQWLRQHFPHVAQSMDRFIAKIKQETSGELVATWRSSGYP